MPATLEAADNPHPGMLAIVRNRRGIISEVRPFSGEDGVLHLVTLEYKDDGAPLQEELIWECEPRRQLLRPHALPQSSDPMMEHSDFDALLRSARWTALSPYLDPDGDGPLDRMPICSPFHGAVEVEDYQLVPLLKALRMPRISLLIADDVGLGKTIEAGLVVRELLIRRRIQRVLILTPASLRTQWREEMWDKFSLPFDIIDRDSTQKLRRQMGIDANPWRSSTRAIASYHYLRQPDVLEQFNSACRVADDSPNLPWDLLIVDEVHNLMPAPFGEDSDLCRTLRLVAPRFEHRLYLTATPHNGRTRSFSGLLELLDPVRFSQTDELKPAEKERIRDVVVRRLKREINARTDPPKFSNRNEPQGLDLEFSDAEQELIGAVDKFRTAIRKSIATGSKKRRLSGTFAVEILGKRLLSGPVTFADSWQRCKLGIREEEQADDSDLLAAKRNVEDETDDDRELEQRNSTASTVIGAWLKPLADELKEEIAVVDRAVEGLRLDLSSDPMTAQCPAHDARYLRLRDLIDELLRDHDNWKSDERLVVFTEYKTTLDYLLQRLRTDYASEQDRFLSLFGGMGDVEREQIKEAFNNPDADVRVLVATDAASEGLNLQETARYLLHYDCPWNPSRIEQRNGRLDRHGQARDVQTFHFASAQDADVRFMAHLITKVDQIREDLGAVGAILDEAIHRRLVEGDDAEDVQHDLDGRVEQVRGSVEIHADDSHEPVEGDGAKQRVDALAAELDLDPESQYILLDTAMGMHAGRPQVTQADHRQCHRIVDPSLSGWSDTIDETIRRTATGSGLGPLPALTFSAAPFMQQCGDRTVFRPNHNIQYLHLGHPLMGKAVSSIARRRFPGAQAVSRWTVRYAELPAAADAVVLLHLEELGINQLRETFHHWIRTLRYPVVGDELGDPLQHLPAIQLRTARPCSDLDDQQRAADLLEELELDLQEEVKRLRDLLTANLAQQLEVDGEQAMRDEQERFRSRQGEVSALIEANTLAKLEREINFLKAERAQGRLWDLGANVDELDRSIDAKEQELNRRRLHYEEVRDQLAIERDRVLNRLLPKRFALEGTAQVFPLAVEVWLPSKGSPS